MSSEGKSERGKSKVLGAWGHLTPDTYCDYGKGVYLFDRKGKKTLDFTAGALGVACIGYGDQRVTQAVVEQMRKVSYFQRGFWLNESLEKLAERLVKVSPDNLKWCMFTSSGSASNETAIKLARQYHVETGNPEKYITISRWQGYHGMTLGALSASGMTNRRAKFEPILFQWPKIGAPLCYRCAWGLDYPSCNIQCARALDDLINQVGSDYVSAFMAEPIGGAATAGMVPVPEYYPMIRAICNKHDVLFIVDEIISGIGRTGKWFGINHWGVNPDMIVSGKALNGGYAPLSAVIIDYRIGKVFAEENVAFAHGFTLANNPVSCSACLAVLDIIEKEGFVERCAGLGEYLHKQAKEKLAHHPTVGDIRGRGLLMGIEIVKEKETREPFDPGLLAAIRVHKIARQKGIMVYPTSGVVKGVKGDQLMASPPFIITKDEIDTALDIIDESLTEFEGKQL